MNSLSEQLPLLVPLATLWVEEREKQAQETGLPLTEEQLHDALLAGVARPENIRLLRVPVIPWPENSVLSDAGRAVGLISPHSAGLTAGYGIYIREDCWGSRQLLVHECVHVSQYERLGGIEPFLEEYLKQCIAHGYRGAPFELEAVEAESKIMH